MLPVGKDYELAEHMMLADYLIRIESYFLEMIWHSCLIHILVLGYFYESLITSRQKWPMCVQLFLLECFWLCHLTPKAYLYVILSQPFDPDLAVFLSIYSLKLCVFSMELIGISFAKHTHTHTQTYKNLGGINSSVHWVSYKASVG